MILTIVIIISILFIILSIYKNYKKEYYDNINLNIGNYLVKYFYLMGKSFLQGNDYTYSLLNIQFIKDLPSYVPLNKKIQQELINNNFTVDELVKEEKEIILVAMWTILNNRREKFWLIMKPLIHEILDTTLKKNNLYMKINKPVIHFRCSDTPFVKNPYYFFQKYKFFKESLEEINGGNDIILLSCNFHKSTDKNTEKCNIYASSLQDYLTSLNYNIDIKCDSNIVDFATIFYAPAIISTCSSFSFMAGFFSDGIFISEGHYNSNDREKRCKDCGEWLKYGYSLEQADVADYYDTDNVIKMLKEK